MLILHVCQTCADTVNAGAAGVGGGKRLLEALRLAVSQHPLAGQVHLAPVNCLMACSEGCNVALSAPNKTCYVLGRWAANADSVATILQYLELYAASPDGDLPLRTWPEAARGHCVARIPPTLTVRD